MSNNVWQSWEYVAHWINIYAPRTPGPRDSTQSPYVILDKALLRSLEIKMRKAKKEGIISGFRAGGGFTKAECRYFEFDLRPDVKLTDLLSEILPKYPDLRVFKYNPENNMESLQVWPSLTHT